MKKIGALMVAAGLVAGAARATDTFEGQIIMFSTLTHSGGTASTLTESIGNLWLWGGGSGSIGTNGAATDLNILYTVNSSLAASGTNSFDLYGSLTDSFGTTVNFAKIKLMMFAPTNAIAGTVTVRPAAAAGFTNWTDSTLGVTVRNGGMLTIAAPDSTGYTVSNSACDALEIVNNTTNAGVVKIILAGE